MGSFYDEESAVATEELNMVQAENNLSTAIIDLTQLMDIDYNPNFPVESPKVDLPDQSAVALRTDEIYNVAMETLPVVRFSDYKVQSAELNLSRIKGFRYPRLSVFGSLSSGYSSLAQTITSISPLEFEKTSFGDQLDNNYNERFGFSLSVPIFNGRSTESNIQRSKISLENARYDQELTHDQLYKDVILAHTQANSAQKRYSAAERSSVAMNESFKYAKKRYELGALSSIEFLKARDNLDFAESEFLQSKYELIFRIKALDFYLGRPLTF